MTPRPTPVRFRPTPTQLRFLRAVDTAGRLDVTGHGANAFPVATRTACRCAGWTVQAGTLGTFAWELTDAGRRVLAAERERV